MDWQKHELTGRVAVVTGSGHGIGAAVVRELASRGAPVVVNDVVAERADAVAREVVESGGRALAVTADVSNPEDVTRLMESARNAFERIDILVNNAATFCIKSFLDHTVEDWDRLFDVNVRGAALCSAAVLPEMIARRSGNIVNMSSIGAFSYTTAHVGYAVTKAAVAVMTRDIAAEVAEFDVRVNAVAPGPIDTHGVYAEPPPEYGILLHHMGQPSDVADAVAFLVSDAARYVTGTTFSVSGGADLKTHRPSSE